MSFPVSCAFQRNNKNFGAEYASPKTVNLSAMAGLCRPKKVKGYLLTLRVQVHIIERLWVPLWVPKTIKKDYLDP